MSQKRGTNEVSFIADATIAAYRVVGPGTAENNVTLHTTETTHIIGVTQDTSTGGTNSSVLVAIGGTCKVMCGASVSSGAVLTVQTATGLAVAAAATTLNTTTTAITKQLGIALENGETNAVIEVALAINNTLIRFA